ncbi:hypothetical protein CTU88_27255 [Streptomyces sp. JV178]|uniref:AbfB domain-containing protein n=1 Tax=Streptomyces sp. JV178 TaxID=858632 RepID=UPI000C1B58C4|nr:AbfB domain-containing protein [Streptomyces sp. JV178]PIM69670.1 hypothetical protein CTU88_27255 [Streptomyces sp. JV178]
MPFPQTGRSRSRRLGLCRDEPLDVRHGHHRAHGKAVFHNDASLHWSAGFAESINGVSSESLNFPGRYTRHLNNLLYVQLAGTALDRQHAAYYAE